MKKLNCRTQDQSIINSDLPLHQWLKKRFGSDLVYISYECKQCCQVNANDATRKQHYLSDQRLLRADWIVSEHKGEKGRWFIRVESPEH